MRVVLPKSSRGYAFPRLSTIEFNDWDVERLFPSLFYLVVTRGYQRTGKAHDSLALAAYVELLSKHERMRGFDDPTGRRVLEKWMRATILRMSTTGRAHKGEQIEFVHPLTILAFKPHFLSESRLHRNVHAFLYAALLRLLDEQHAQPSSKAVLNDYFQTSFGRGVVLGPAPLYAGQYDGHSDLDIHAMLSLCFLDGFDAKSATKRLDLDDPVLRDPALPQQVSLLAGRILGFLLGYRKTMPLMGLTRALMSLTNLELFVYTLRLWRLAAQVVSSDSMREAPSLELFVDFTRVRGSVSDELARACVDRDLELTYMAYGAILRLRTIHRFVEINDVLRGRLSDLRGEAYLRSLMQLHDDPAIVARAQAELDLIRVETEGAISDSEQEEWTMLFEDERKQANGDSLELVCRLLSRSQERKVIANYVRWFYSTGGIRKSFGLLVGNARGRRNWRYAMSDDLLAALVRMAVLKSAGGDFRSAHRDRRLRLKDFLTFLEESYGLLIDRPPAFLDSAVAREAARANLEALRERLRQMGLFESLSDDYAAQYIALPALEATS